jgi:hypothetical protein
VPLNTAQRRVLENWVRSKAILKCPSCGQDKGRFESAQDDTLFPSCLQQTHCPIFYAVYG